MGCIKSRKSIKQGFLDRVSLQTIEFHAIICVYWQLTNVRREGFNASREDMHLGRMHLGRDDCNVVLLLFGEVGVSFLSKMDNKDGDGEGAAEGAFTFASLLRLLLPKIALPMPPMLPKTRRSANF